MKEVYYTRIKFFLFLQLLRHVLKIRRRNNNSIHWHVYITDGGINMKSEHRVYTHRRVYILSVYRSESDGFRHTGETASILKAIWTPVSRGTRKRILPPLRNPSPDFDYRDTLQPSIICGRSQRLIIQGRLIDYTNHPSNATIGTVYRSSTPLS